MNIYIEIFGYCGTALVLLSMMMTSLTKLRIFNSIGSLISLIYAYLGDAWPVVMLNLGILIINVVQLIRLRYVKVTFHHQKIQTTDAGLTHFLTFFAEDIRKFFPNFAVGENMQGYMVYRDAEPVGVLLGSRQGEAITVELDYSTPQYRDCSVAAYLFDKLKEDGVSSMTATADTQAHSNYLRKMGFIEENGAYTKQL